MTYDDLTYIKNDCQFDIDKAVDKNEQIMKSKLFNNRYYFHECNEGFILNCSYFFQNQQNPKKSMLIILCMTI